MMSGRGKVARARLFGVLVACSGALASGTALAGTAADSANTGPSAEASGGLEDIIVTATRREQSIQSVPISINAFNADELAQGNIKSIEDIAALTPGLQFAIPNGFSSAFTTIAIRGLNTNTGPPTVGLYLDDTVISSRLSGYANQGNAYPYVFDLNRVEVARGPQGTLFGAGSEAGTVRFISNAPSLTDFSGLARAELASTEGGRLSYETGLALGGPIAKDVVGFRLSVWDRSDGGWVNRVDPITGQVVSPNANTNDKLAVKAALAFQPGDGVLVTPAFYYQRSHQDDAQRFYAIFSDAQAGIFDNGPLLPETWTDTWTLPSIKLEAHLPFAELTATTSYLDRNVSELLDQSIYVCPGLSRTGCGSPLGIGYPASPLDVAYTPTGLAVRAYTGEVRLASNTPGARVSWVAGLYYEHRLQTDFQTSYDQAVVPSAPTLLDAIFQDQHERFTDVQAAAFAQADIHVTDQLIATLGERVANVKVTVAEITNISAITGAPPYTVSSSTANPTTPRLALSYQLDRDNLFYASYSKGFRPGGGNASGTYCNFNVPATYQADSNEAYEVGAKNTLFGGRVQTDTSVFYNKWKDIQQYVSLSCGPYAYSTNAGSAVSDGFDLALRALVTEQLRFDLNLGFVNAYYSQSGYDGSGNILVGKGDKVGILPQVNPPWTVNASLNYEIPVRQGEKIHLRGETNYTSQNPGPFITQLQNSQNTYPLATPDPATHMYNARAGYQVNKVDVTFFVNNIFNNTPELSKYQGNPASNLITYTTFRPRTIGVTANVAF